MGNFALVCNGPASQMLCLWRKPALLDGSVIWIQKQKKLGSRSFDSTRIKGQGSLTEIKLFVVAVKIGHFPPNSLSIFVVFVFFSKTMDRDSFREREKKLFLVSAWAAQIDVLHFGLDSKKQTLPSYSILKFHDGVRCPRSFRMLPG